MVYHLEEREVRGRDTVKVDGRVDPRVVEVCQFKASDPVWDERCIDGSLIGVLAAVEASAEQTDTHDTEHQPEDEADEQDVEDGGNSLDECVHDHLANTQRNT